jgi:hypothetical protein
MTMMKMTMMTMTLLLWTDDQEVSSLKRAVEDLELTNQEKSQACIRSLSHSCVASFNLPF